MNTFIQQKRDWLNKLFESSLDRSSVDNHTISVGMGHTVGYAAEMQDILSSDIYEQVSVRNLVMAMNIRGSIIYIKKFYLIKNLFCFGIFYCCMNFIMTKLFCSNVIFHIQKNVYCLVKIENETYYCKRGYYWSINPDFTKLTLTRISPLNELKNCKPVTGILGS